MRKHTVASGFSGIRNLEFFGLSPTGAVGHMRDAITIGRVHFIDMSTSRDCTTIKGSSPTVLNIPSTVNDIVKIAAGRECARAVAVFTKYWHILIKNQLPAPHTTPTNSGYNKQ